MSNEPLIVAARRRARMLSRQTGASYQTQLDAVAREAGRANWNEFLKDPVALGNDTPNVPVDPFAAPLPGRRGTGRHLPRLRTLAKLAALLTVIAGLIAAAFTQQGRQDEVNDQVMRDRMDHGSADWFQRNVPIARNVQVGDMHMVDLVFVDSRPLFANWTYLVPKALGYDTRIMYGGRSEGFRKILQATPIMIMRMHANCRNGKWRMAAIAAATSYETKPAGVEYLKRQPSESWPVMTERNRHAICDKPDNPGFQPVESPTRQQYALQTMPAGNPSKRSDRDDTRWYGIDILHPRYRDDPAERKDSGLFGLAQSDGAHALDRWRAVETPRGWTEAEQDPGSIVPTDAESGPVLILRLKTRTPEAAKAAAWLIGTHLARRFNLGPHSSVLLSSYGTMSIKVRFSASPRADRPMSSTLRSVTMRQNDDGVEMQVAMRGRYVRDVYAWRRSLDM